MKKSNLWHIIWIVGVYFVLIAVLYLVINYKVKWENKDLSKYLYFYKCSNELCTTEIPVKEYISLFKCEDDICPYIKERENDILILANNDKEYIYDYRNGRIISDKYKNYMFTDTQDYFIAQNDNDKYGIIDSNNTIIIPFNYDNITSYKDNLAVFADNLKYGVLKKNEDNIDVLIEPQYDSSIILINDKLFAYKGESGYIINSYTDNKAVNNNIYDYIHAYKDILFVSINNHIDILDTNLNSRISNKITTYYTYASIGEIDTLRIKHDNNLFHFSIYNENNTYLNYIYDLKNKKLYG